MSWRFPFSKGVWFFPFKIETAQLNSIISSGQKYLLDSIGGNSFYFLHLSPLFMSVYNLQGAMSVDSITDLDDNQSRLLEALQLSLPAEAQNKKEKARDKNSAWILFTGRSPGWWTAAVNILKNMVSRLVCQQSSTWMYSSIIHLNTQILYSFDQALGRNFLCEESLHSVGITPVGINKIWGGDKLDDIQTP